MTDRYIHLNGEAVSAIETWKVFYNNLILKHMLNLNHGTMIMGFLCLMLFMTSCTKEDFLSESDDFAIENTQSPKDKKQPQSVVKEVVEIMIMGTILM